MRIPDKGLRQSNAIEIRPRIISPATIAEIKCTRKICETRKEKLMFRRLNIIIVIIIIIIYHHHHHRRHHYLHYYHHHHHRRCRRHYYYHFYYYYYYYYLCHFNDEMMVSFCGKGLVQL